MLEHRTGLCDAIPASAFPQRLQHLAPKSAPKISSRPRVSVAILNTVAWQE